MMNVPIFLAHTGCFVGSVIGEHLMISQRIVFVFAVTCINFVVFTHTTKKKYLPYTIIISSNSECTR